MATIAWLVPSLIEGSGGHRTILQHADCLQRAGHRSVIYLENYDAESPRKLQKSIKDIFGFDFDDVRSGWAHIEPADMVFATIWYSARVVRDLHFDGLRCYFVQDYEAQFNPMGTAYVMAENSYRYGLHPITIGRWLPARLADGFGIESAYFDFCADLDVYRRLQPYVADKTVSFIFQPEKPRRCAELGIEALGIVKHRMPEVRIQLYGSKSPGHVWFEHDNLGLLGLDECNRLYNRSGVGLCISTTNPSRIPFEMMAAGLPVVEVYGDNTRYDLPPDAVSLCEPTPESLAKGILGVLADPVRAAAMSSAGVAFMQDRPLQFGLDQFRGTVDGLLAGTGIGAVSPRRLYNLPPVRFDPAVDTQISADSGSMTPTRDVGRLAFLPEPIRSAARAGHRMFRRMRK